MLEYDGNRHHYGFQEKWLKVNSILVDCTNVALRIGGVEEK